MNAQTSNFKDFIRSDQTEWDQTGNRIGQVSYSLTQLKRANLLNQPVDQKKKLNILRQQFIMTEGQ